jgi:hypothetical protein
VKFVFPTAMLAMSVGAAIVYAFDGDVRRTIYWLAAAVITASVTY